MDIERPDLFQKKRRTRRMVGIIVAVISIIVCVYVFTLGKPIPNVQRSQIWLGKVQRGDMLRNVRGLGKLVPQDTHWITARSSGRIEERFVLSGASVEKDTVILTLSNPQLEQDHLNAQLALKAAEAELISTRVRLKGELLALRSSYVQLKEQTEMAILDEEINHQLFEDGLVSELNRKRSELSAKHLKERLKMETERLEFQRQSIDPQLATQQTQVDRARAQLKLLEDKVEALALKAGSTGILQRLEVEVGMQVSEGQEIALVSDLSKLKGVIEIQESQAREVEVGQIAVVDTRTSGKVEATVARIDPNVERGIVKVDVFFNQGLPDGCRADQTIQGIIELQRLVNVLYADRSTTAKENSEDSLFVIETNGNRATRVPVQYGKSSVNLIEIISGLNPGDEVILSDTSRWDGSESIEIK